jgi:hypothetical protein
VTVIILYCSGYYSKEEEDEFSTDFEPFDKEQSFDEPSGSFHRRIDESYTDVHTYEEVYDKEKGKNENRSRAQTAV